MAKLNLVLFLVALGISQSLTTPQIESSVFETLKSTDSVTIILTMKENGQSHQDVLDNLGRSSFDNRVDTLNGITRALKEHSHQIQKNVLSMLSSDNQQDVASGNSPQLEVIPLWITGQVIVKGANLDLVKRLAEREDITKVEQDQMYSILKPIDMSESFEINDDLTQSTVQWGAEAVKAPTVWNNGNKGEGIVVGVIDTGARGTHVALKNSWRNSYGWFDPANKTTVPNDGHGHGTHTTGTIVGTANGIGVAPAAKWIHCRGCGTQSCAQSDLLQCGQWMSCPTDTSGSNEDCSQAPHIVSNSWGGFGGSSSYDKVIATWRAQKIIPVFAAGNNGPICLTIGSPADNPDVIAVGSTAKGDKMSYFSSSGPGYKRFLIKPDVSAPGSDIISASKNSDTEYMKMSGTSMACPHTAGVIALMMSKNKSMSFDDVKGALTKSCDPTKPAFWFFYCGGNSPGKTFPNNNAGYGRINAVKAVGPGK